MRGAICAIFMAAFASISQMQTRAVPASSEPTPPAKHDAWARLASPRLGILSDLAQTIPIGGAVECALEMACAFHKLVRECLSKMGWPPICEQSRRYPPCRVTKA